ncbi:MAG: hypothetical protein NWQ19_06045 [Nonlabens sp.]|nr:hypothetical protein [Nonlabens sp.]
MKHALLFITLLLFNTAPVIAQDVYKTPSGEKYHLSSCRMVKNVSEKVALKSNELKTLEPCKICKPPAKAHLVQSLSNSKNAAGTGVTVQCNGKTKAGTRCKHKTSIANGYC